MLLKNKHGNEKRMEVLLHTVKNKTKTVAGENANNSGNIKMKKIINIFILFIILYFHSSAQKNSITKELKVYSITEYIDGYIITTIDTSKSDTINIISAKEPIINKHDYEKIVVGKKYDFEYEDLIHQMAAMPLNNFVVRIKTTVVWKPSDDTKNIPVYSRNTKGVWIKKQSKTL